MRVLRKTATRPNYLFELLPYYFKENDSYKDVNNEGLLERYLEIFCHEIDDEVVPYIDNIAYLYDAKNLLNLPHSDPLKFLDHIADLFGNPPNIGTDTQYKILLRYIRLIFQTKGTKQALSYFLAIYGYKIFSLTESGINIKKYDASPTLLEYDEGGEYDYGFNFYSGWDLIITDLPGTGNKFPNDVWLYNLQSAVQKFIAPIFATLNSITYTGYMVSMGSSSVTGTLTGI